MGKEKTNKRIKKEKIKKQKKTTANKKKHLTKEERFTIEKMLNANKTQKEIAQVLGRGYSTICEEIKKGKVKGVYSANKAHRKARVRQHMKKNSCFKVSMNKDLYSHIEKRIKEKVSPEAISNELKKDKLLPYASAKAIRKFLKKRRPDLLSNLFWERNNKKKGQKKNKDKYLKDKDRKTTEQRAQDFPYFDLEYGHWEGDFIVSKKSPFVLLVLVERFSKYTILSILPKRENALVNKRIFSLLKNFRIKSLTLDNDIAFQAWKGLGKLLNCNIYFTKPYSSWEKGLVENTNRWIREFIPKKTDLSEVSESYVRAVQNYLNYKPRVVLDGRSALAVLWEKEKGGRAPEVMIKYPEKNSYLGVGRPLLFNQ